MSFEFNQEFAPSALPVFYRTYSRGKTESWSDVCLRTVEGLRELGKLTEEEVSLIKEQQEKFACLPSGRWLWVGGTEWLKNPANVYGSYNCSSTNVVDWESFGLMMNLAMQGTGTGAVLEDKYISQLPAVKNKLEIKIVQKIGEVPKELRSSKTEVLTIDKESFVVVVGDSRQGWVDSYQTLLELSSDLELSNSILVEIYLGNVRKAGEKLNGFGGTANPEKLTEVYGKIASILNKAIGRNLTAKECCLIIDEAALTIVAGNIRRCIAKNERVYTSKGIKFIQDIKVGDLVRTRNGYRKVIEFVEQGKQGCFSVVTDFAVLKCTPDHQIAVAKKDGEIDWKKARDLATADTLIYQFENSSELERVEILFIYDLRDEVETYDIEVEEEHEFFCEGLLVHNSAGMRQGSPEDKEFAEAKDNLWQQTEDGQWQIDPERDALRMANHTLVYHRRPSFEELKASVAKQYYSGEGAIQWAGEAVARANADLLKSDAQKAHFLRLYDLTNGVWFDMSGQYLVSLALDMTLEELEHRMSRYGLNPCAEVIGSGFLCNLSEVHLNTIDPLDLDAQKKAFRASGISVAVLLNHEFPDKRFQKSRELDPIVGVSFTGGFDFFVKLFGIDYLKWWEAGRPEEWRAVDNPKVWFATNCFPEEVALGNIYKRIEQMYFSLWSKIAHEAVWKYCDERGLKRPNRCTVLQPAGSKSLLTGASPGWHPPKAAYFLRRITFGKEDAIALACRDFGYNIVPSQSDKDENGNLLTDPFDPRTTEWLVEIPTKAAWADLEGADQIDISKFSVKAQWDFYMQVQQFYTSHNSSATIEIRESEIEEYAQLLYDNIHFKNGSKGGYISAALLARFDDRQTFPRLPFEPISKQEYETLSKEVVERRGDNNDFDALVKKYIGRGRTGVGQIEQAGPAGCDSDKCLLPLRSPGA